MRMRVCACVCVCERERMNKCVSVGLCVMYVYVYVCANQIDTVCLTCFTVIASKASQAAANVTIDSIRTCCVINTRIALTVVYHYISNTLK